MLIRSDGYGVESTSGGSPVRERTKRASRVDHQCPQEEAQRSCGKREVIAEVKPSSNGV